MTKLAPRIVARGPLTWTQELLYHLELRGQGQPLLGVYHAVVVEGALDADALADAFAWVIARHEPLRTRYVRRGGVPRAEVLAHVVPDFWREDLRSLPRNARTATLQTIVRSTTQRPFALGFGQSARLVLVRLAAKRWVLLFGVHHLSADAWSLAILATDLSRAYRQLGARRSLPSEHSMSGCLEEARRQRAWLRTIGAQAQLDWWRERLASLQPRRLRLRGLRARRTRPTLVRRRQAVQIAPTKLRFARAAAAGANASLFMLLLAVFKDLLVRRSGQSSIVVGTLVANRSTVSAAAALGAHYNNVLIGTKLRAGLAPPSVLARVARSCFESLDRQALPCALVTAALERSLGLSAEAFLQFTFLFGTRPLYELDLGTRLSELDLGRGEPLHRPPTITEHWAGEAAELALIAWESEAGLTIYLDYAKGVFDDEAVRELLKEYLQVLDTFVYALSGNDNEDGRALRTRVPPFGLIREAVLRRPAWLLAREKHAGRRRGDNRARNSRGWRRPS